MIKNILKKIFLRLGYEIRPLYLSSDEHCLVADDLSRYLPGIKQLASKVPGMISLEEGILLYLFVYLNQNKGDVIEIGSWQGRSTVFLASACRDTKNGRVHAIDPFTGNAGQEDAYRVNQKDLSDLQLNFNENLRKADLSDWVTQYPCRAEEASKKMSHISPRILFIDGDHSYDGVKSDIEYFMQKIQLGGWIIFDDYRPASEGVVRAVKEDVLDNEDFGNYLQTENFFFAQRK